LIFKKLIPIEGAEGVEGAKNHKIEKPKVLFNSQTAIYTTIVSKSIQYRFRKTHNNIKAPSRQNEGADGVSDGTGYFWLKSEGANLAQWP
jgi:hypothetical protein